jgi:predicted helicase
MDKINIIRKLIINNINTNKNKFDCLIDEIDKYIDGTKAHNIQELKEKANNKKKKGDLFEAFCYLYLELFYDKVWFYKSFPKELKLKFSLTKNDYGIDLLAMKNDNYYAIQCKYRKPTNKIQLIPWRSLSTFYGIVVKTGPWTKHIVMTNVNGCKYIGEQTSKDLSLCLFTFRNIDHFSWLKLSNYQESLNDFKKALSIKSNLFSQWVPLTGAQL